MRFKGLKSFTIGKSKEKPEDEKTDTNDATAAQIAEMEEKISSRTKGLEDTAQKLQELNGATEKLEEEKEEATPKPHGPLSELSVEPEDQVMDVDLDADVSTSELLEKDEAEAESVETIDVTKIPATEGNELKKEDADNSLNDEEVKLVEVNAEEDAPAAEGKETKPENADDSLNNLFDDEEEEVNPLANLINSLPDVTAQELVDDLDEIKEIMKEWQQS